MARTRGLACVPVRWRATAALAALVLALTGSGPAFAAGPLRVGDRALSLAVGADGRIGALAVNGRDLLTPGQTAGLAVTDLGTPGAAAVNLRGTATATPTGVTVTAEAVDLGLRTACRITPGPRHTIALDLAVDDLRHTERGLTLEFAVPVGSRGWTWWDGPDAAKLVQPGERYASLTRLRGLPGLPEFDNKTNLTDFGSYSWFPVAAITGASGLGLAKPPRAASLFRLGFDGSRGVLYCAFDFALSPDTKAPGHAEFALVLFPLDPAQGFRGALAELYELWPDDFQSRVPSYGGWMPFRRLSAIRNVDEFGFAYQEGAPEPIFEDALGVSSFVYFHCAGEFVNIPGYTRGTPLPPYEQQLAAVNATIKQRTGIADLWDRTGVCRPDGTIEILPESTYGHLFCQACVHPALPYGKFMVDNLVGRVNRDEFPKGIDGCYYDGIAVGLDYSREHFKVAGHPLLWDATRKRAVAYNFFASLEWAATIAEQVHPKRKLTMLNDSSVSSFPFVFPYIDVLGAEGGWVNGDDSFLRIRAYAYHKPFCTLLKTNYKEHPQARIESYMRSCVAFGHLPGFFDISPSGANPGSSYWEHPEWFDRDRALFRRYMPLAAELCRAGWEPVPLATTATPGARLERFGGGRNGDRGDVVFLTVRRATDAAGGDAVGLALARALRSAQVADAIAVDLLTGATLRFADGTVSVPVPPGEIGVIAIGPRNAQARHCLDRVARLIAARERYEQARQGQKSALGDWEPYTSGGEVVADSAHSGTASLRVRLQDAKRSAGALQTIALNQDQPEDLIVKGFSRAENVSGDKGRDYGIYVDCYYRGGDALYGQVVEFDAGTHDWQGGEIRLHPAKPIANVNVYCMFRGHTGTAWFDDISLATVAAPEKNLLKSPGFESEVDGGGSAVVAEGSKRLGTLRDRLLKLRSLDEPVSAQLAESAERDLAWVAAQPPDADTERLGRDCRDVRDQLELVRAIVGRAPLAKTWPQRLTPAFALAAAAPQTGTATVAAGVTAAGQAPKGTKVTVDSTFEGYSPAPLTDGRINPKTDDWAAVAWASAEETGEHWLALEFPAPRRVAKLVLHWALDNGSYYPSRKLTIEVRTATGRWQPAKDANAVAAPDGASTTVTLAPVEARGVRVRQPAGGGSTARPNLMWVSEVEVF